jgi:predicted CoA-binding protein
VNYFTKAGLKMLKRVNKSQVIYFLSKKSLALVGASRDEKSFSRHVMDNLKERGFEIFPVNPFTDEICGTNCYRNLGELMGKTDRALLLTNKSITLSVLEEAEKAGFNQVWIQQGSEDKESLNFALDKFENVIYKQCIMMHSPPVEGLHKFHRTLNRVFGLLPR